MPDSLHSLAPASAPRPRRRRWLAATAMVCAFAAGGVALPALTAFAEDGAAHAMMGVHGQGDMHRMAMAHVSRLLDRVSATADQKTRIAAILHDGFEPMARFHTDLAGAHAALFDLLAAPVTDRGALETLRAGEVARIDQASRVATQALADAVDVLSPEQRARLAALTAGHKTGL